MKKLILLVMAALFLLTPLAHAAGNVGSTSAPGPAPNSGDGIPDGSGMEDTGACLTVGLDECPGPGAAPNSGDGVPDGSGFVAPPKGAK